MVTRKGKLRRQKRRRRRLLLLILAMILVPILFFGTKYTIKFFQTNAQVKNELKRGTTSEKRDEAVKKEDPFSILLIGTDQATKEEKGRSDTMIIVTVNPKSDTMKMTSVPRDMRVKIPGHNDYSKINAAFAEGGADLTIETIENEFDIPIDNYVQINFQGFKDMVNIFGGIDVNNKFKFKELWYDFPAGPLHLDGDQALAYVRMRKSDPQGDYGRQERQKEAIKIIMGRAKSFDSIKNFEGIMDTVGTSVKSSYSILEMWDLKEDYSDALNNVESVKIQAKSATIRAQSYELLPYDERIRITELIRTHLDLPLKDRSTYPNNDKEIAK